MHFQFFSNVREVNNVYPIHNGNCHKQQMINNDKLNHEKPQLQEEEYQFVNLLPDKHAKFVIVQWITCVVPKLANLLMHSQCALSELISSSRKTRKLAVGRFI